VQVELEMVVQVEHHSLYQLLQWQGMVAAMQVALKTLRVLMPMVMAEDG
jgi:predicted small integral membrane protein